MRERLKDPGRLEHIISAITQIEDNKKIYSDEDILGNSIIFFGFTKLLEIIGEAVYMLTKEFKESHPEVDWDPVQGMRHVLVHGYYTIDPITVVKAINNDLPIFKKQILALIKTINQ